MKVLTIDDRDGVALVTLDRPPVNALDVETLDGLSDAFDDLAAQDPNAVILTGTGKVFSAGADLARILEGDESYIDAAIVALSRAFRTLFTFPRPLVAAINGHSLAGGAVIAACCDRRIMADGDGRIGAIELAAGVPFPAWALEPVRWATGGPRFQESALFGRSYDPFSATAIGLIDEVASATELLDRSLAACGELARVPRITFRLTKEMMRAPAVDAADRRARETDEAVKSAWKSAEVIDAVGRTMAHLRRP